MTYADVLDIAVPKLEDKHLTRYVEAFEGGTLKNGCVNCAVGHMAREPGEHESTAYCRYDREHGFAAEKRLGPRKLDVAERHPLRLVELVFEGWCRSLGYPDMPNAPDAERARLIYERSIEEIASRASANTESAVLKAEAVNA